MQVQKQVFILECVELDEWPRISATVVSRLLGPLQQTLEVGLEQLLPQPRRHLLPVRASQFVVDHLEPLEVDELALLPAPLPPLPLVGGAVGLLDTLLSLLFECLQLLPQSLHELLQPGQGLPRRSLLRKGLELVPLGSWPFLDDEHDLVVPVGQLAAQFLHLFLCPCVLCLAHTQLIYSILLSLQIQNFSDLSHLLFY